MVNSAASVCLARAPTNAYKARSPALARAWRWQKLLDEGIYGSIAEMADKEGINRSYLSRTIRLSLLAPDIVDAILNSTQPAALQLAALEGPFSIDWEQQRAALGFAANPSR
jgi:hypothetical protein